MEAVVVPIELFTFVVKYISVCLSTTTKSEESMTVLKLENNQVSTLVHSLCSLSAFGPSQYPLFLFSTCYNVPTYIFVYIYKYIIGQSSQMRENLWLPYLQIVKEKKMVLSVLSSLAMFYFHTSLKKEKSPYLLPFSTEHTPISLYF